MKKIGILTFHKSINFGAYLQSYTLATQLQKRTDYQVEIIDYNIVSNFQNDMKFILSKSVIRSIKKMNQLTKIKKAQWQLPLSEKTIITKDIQYISNYINSYYDVVIVGSDEVWKINKLRGFPNVYWLPDSISCIKLSYAASANRTDFDHVTDADKTTMKKWFDCYSYIGVRDQNTYNMIEKIGKDLMVQLTPDPTMLYPLNEKVDIDALKKRLSEKYKIAVGKDKIICLLTNNSQIGKFIKEQYGQGYKLISIFLNNPYSDCFIYDIDPFEWASVFQFFNLCITPLFHGTIFSIKHGIPFISIDSESIYGKYESKIFDLLKRGDLMNHYYFLNGGVEEGKLTTMIDEVLTNKEREKQKMLAFVLKEQAKFDQFITSFNEIILQKNTN